MATKQEMPLCRELQTAASCIMIIKKFIRELHRNHTESQNYRFQWDPAGISIFRFLVEAPASQDVGFRLEEINSGGYHTLFKENGVNGEYLEGAQEDKVACLKGEQKVRRPWWAPSCLSVVFTKVAKRNRQSRVVSLKLEP
ncbi:hypothetical protein HAX54_048879 [Datura stramonium]|uniref:Uncharacterized protein n=1 Tax=Datura stramonium TaxID=4076 RepID=A0ABS8WLT4_DATST|nr:hypothetical protein [Datura stramonium]